MIRKLTLAAGFGAGYVLGAKAGTERYNQISAKFRELAGMPAVQDVKNNLADTASTLGDTAKAKVNDTISAAGDKVTGGSSDVVDLGASTPKAKTGARTTTTPATPATPTTPTTATTATTPMAGAAPSVTAPDA